MPFRLLIYLLLLAGFGCQHKQGFKHESPVGKPKYFQTEGMDNIFINIDSSSEEWYSKQLLAMNEPVFRDKPDGRGFRFLWLRTFHHPIAIRIENHGSASSLIAIELDGYGGYEPGEMMRKLEIKLTQDQWKDIQSKFDKAGFWNLKSLQTGHGCDGAQWVFEGYQPSRYKAVSVWSPDKGQFYDLGLYLIHITGWTFPVQEVY